MELRDAIDCIHHGVECIRGNRPYSELPIEELPEQVQPLAQQVNALAAAVQQLNCCVVALSKGKLDIELPPRSNAIAGGVKQLHSHLQHLTWQTQQIANGDYDQSVDYLGDFSNSFNAMILQLKEREAHLNANSIIMSTVFDHIENLFIVNAQDRNRAYIISACARRTFNIEGEAMDLTDAMHRSAFLKELFLADFSVNRQINLFDAEAQNWYYVITSRLTWHGEDAILIYCTDISVQKQREALLEQDALTDALTGIANRRALEIVGTHNWRHAVRMQFPTSMIIIDIDLFKQYNDTYGHLQGDCCLRAVASCMRGTICRASDIVVRYGGEEFLVMLPNTESAPAQKIAERLRCAIEALRIPLTSDENVITHVTCSLGVATCIPTADGTVEDLIHMADEALYRAKKGGRNRVVAVQAETMHLADHPTHLDP